MTVPTQNGKTTSATVAPASMQLIAPSASPEEAAAVVAAIERFMRATAPAPSTGAAAGPNGWRRAAMLEGVEREAQGDLRDPWLGA